MIRLRESFAAKLLAAFLGIVGLLLVAIFVVLRNETGREVEAATARTARNAGALFDEFNQLQLQQAAQVARPFTQGRRAAIMLDEAINSGDVEFLAGQVSYEVALAGLDDVLLVFTGPLGRPILTMVGGQRVEGIDPADIADQIRPLLSEEAVETSGYWLVDDRMYYVRSVFVELGFRPIGTITFGLPIQADDMARIGQVGGFEACLYRAGACRVATPGVLEDEEVRAALLRAAGSAASARTDAGGRPWSVRVEALVPDRPDAGLRVVAVPLDAVLAPFDRIRRALLLGGGGSLLAAVLLGAALSRSLTRPVRQLVAAAGRVAEGDYETGVEVTTRDEIGTLAEAFNDMTRGLAVREQYRSVLNKVVSRDVAEELMRGDVVLGGESREITVLFADLRGFTALTERMAPEATIALLNECMECLAEAVDAEGGVVDKFIGDEIMAVFGAPARQEDHALRALRAAVRMRQGVEEVNHARATRGEPPVGIGIGISSGDAVAGNMGSHDRLNYTVVGATVNLAARLTQQAAPGEILTTGRTVEAAGEGVTARPAGARALKGFSDEVEVWVVEEVATPAA